MRLTRAFPKHIENKGSRRLPGLRLEWLEDRLDPSYLIPNGDIVVTNFPTTFSVDNNAIVAVNPGTGAQTTISGSALFSKPNDITEAPSTWPSSWGYGP